MAVERTILARKTPGATRLASRSDFLTGRGTKVALREAFLESPAELSPFSIELARREVVFVRTDAGLDLADAHPFFYAAQRKHATSTLTASFEEVEALGDDLAGVSARFAFLYSAGRSGSTVAGKIASSFPGVQSLSEPDIYAHAATARTPGDAEKDRALVRIVRAASRVFAANRAAVDPARRTLLVKQRGLGVFGAPVVHVALPNARAIYLDRDPAAVVDSYLGAFLGNPVVGFARRVGLDRMGVAVLRKVIGLRNPWVLAHMPEVIDVAHGASPADGAVEVLARSIVAMSHAATRYAQTGAVRFDAFLRYETYESDVTRFARELAEGLGLRSSDELDVALDGVDAIASVDAQAGSTVASRKTSQLSDDDVRRIERVMKDGSGRVSVPDVEAAA